MPGKDRVLTEESVPVKPKMCCDNKHALRDYFSHNLYKKEKASAWLFFHRDFHILIHMTDTKKK